MPKEIVDTKLSGDLIANPDVIWSGEALANAGTITSGAFKLGQTLGGVEVKVVTNTGGTLAGNVTVELKLSATEDGSYVTESSDLVNLGTVLADGDDIARFILPREIEDLLYAKLAITTAGADQAILVDAYPVFVS